MVCPKWMWLVHRNSDRRAREHALNLYHLCTDPLTRTFCLLLLTTTTYYHNVAMSNEDALTTLTLLEQRLNRLEYLFDALHGRNAVEEPRPQASSNETVTGRLRELEDGFQRLAGKSSLVREILKLSR